VNWHATKLLMISIFLMTILIIKIQQNQSSYIKLKKKISNKGETCSKFNDQHLCFNVWEDYLATVEKVWRRKGLFCSLWSHLPINRTSVLNLKKPNDLLSLAIKLKYITLHTHLWKLVRHSVTVYDHMSENRFVTVLQYMSICVWKLFRHYV
jgi:hypothetical protein